MKSDKRICPYLDMPIQHVNNQVLKAMRRQLLKKILLHIITQIAP